MSVITILVYSLNEFRYSVLKLHLSKCSTQIYRAQMSIEMPRWCPCRGATTPGPEINENIWISLLTGLGIKSSPGGHLHEQVNFHINTSRKTSIAQIVKNHRMRHFFKQRWKPSGSHLDVVWHETLKFIMFYVKGRCHQAKNLQQDIYLV